ncbi:MAG: HPr family phosphocarrier protein [Thiobacillus sp.]|nr:HPr family phosphocarrier protein [Thiobacillus sp.]
MHARPSARLTQLASSFKSQVFMSRNGRRVNAKSIMGVMMLAAAKGSTITLETDGEDEVEAINTLADLITSGFGEELA